MSKRFLTYSEKAGDGLNFFKLLFRLSLSTTKMLRLNFKRLNDLRKVSSLGETLTFILIGTNTNAFTNFSFLKLVDDTKLIPANLTGIKPII